MQTGTYLFQACQINKKNYSRILHSLHVIIILGTIDTTENIYSNDINSVFVATIGSVRLCNIINMHVITAHVVINNFKV
mgnify:CR=1 FL=1